MVKRAQTQQVHGLMVAEPAQLPVVQLQASVAAHRAKLTAPQGPLIHLLAGRWADRVLQGLRTALRASWEAS